MQHQEFRGKQKIPLQRGLSALSAHFLVISRAYSGRPSSKLPYGASFWNEPFTRRAEDRDKGVALSLICLLFLISALCGGTYIRLDQKHALVPCAAMVAVGFLLTWKERLGPGRDRRKVTVA
jgi:hypothetical protein